MTEIPNDIKKLSFEDAMSELEEIVDNLESGNIDLSIDVANTITDDDNHTTTQVVALTINASLQAIDFAMDLIFFDFLKYLLFLSSYSCHKLILRHELDKLKYLLVKF